MQAKLVFQWIFLQIFEYIYLFWYIRMWKYFYILQYNSKYLHWNAARWTRRNLKRKIVTCIFFHQVLTRKTNISDNPSRAFCSKNSSPRRMREREYFAGIIQYIFWPSWPTLIKIHEISYFELHKSLLSYARYVWNFHRVFLDARKKKKKKLRYVCTVHSTSYIRTYKYARCR